MKNDFGAGIVRKQIYDIIHGTTLPNTPAREEALASVRWFLATSDGRTVGLCGKAAELVPHNKAQIFDGRDNEETKRHFFEALLGVELQVIPLKIDAAQS